MAPYNPMLSEFPWDERYRLTGIEDVLTPALLVYPDVLAANIACTLHLLAGNADRWRAHIKTAKLAYTLRMDCPRLKILPCWGSGRGEAVG